MMKRDPQIPDGWQVVRLDDVAEIVGGSTPSRSRKEFWDGNVSWVVPSELTDLQGRYLTVTNDSITDEGMKSSGLRLIPVGSVLLTSRATIGVTAINAIPVTTNQGFQNLVVKNGADSLWLYYSISSLRKELERRAAGSTFLEVSRDSVRSLPLFLPPLPEQRTIAAVLDSIDEAIERTDAVITAMECLRDALLHELLTRGVPGWHSEWKDVPGLGMMPASWEVVRLGDVAEVASVQADPREKRFQRELFVAPDDIESGTGRLLSRRTVADAAAISGKYQFSKGDILYSKIRPYLMKVYIPKESGLCSADIYPLRPNAALEPSYLAAVLLTPQFTAYTRTCSDRTGIPKVNRVDLFKYSLSLPPLAEQRAIAAVLDGVDEATERAREEKAGLRSLKASAGEALLTGRVRVAGEGDAKLDFKEH